MASVLAQEAQRAGKVPCLEARTLDCLKVVSDYACSAQCQEYFSLIFYTSSSISECIVGRKRAHINGHQFEVSRFNACYCWTLSRREGYSCLAHCSWTQIQEPWNVNTKGKISKVRNPYSTLRERVSRSPAHILLSSPLFVCTSSSFHSAAIWANSRLKKNQHSSM